ncbi:MAG: hypothetical protein JXB33_09065 [Clostridia bacterium]|nr:hypothetical protein [Clostridia bacterium]
MKRKILAAISLAMIIAMLAVPVSAAKPGDGPARVEDTVSASVTPADYPATTLMAGQDMPVGTVYINACAEPNTYEVRYVVDAEGWWLSEVHFEAINNGDLEFIMNNGSLIPGKFTVNQKFEPGFEVKEYSFKYESDDEVLDFAAHAVVTDAPVGLENGKLYGTRTSGVKGIYEIDAVAGSINLLKAITGGAGDVNNGTGYTNALAYDPGSNKLFFTAPSRVGVSPSPLYAYDITSDTLEYICDLEGSVVSASFHQGAYYYIAEEANSLMRLDNPSIGGTPVEVHSGFGAEDSFTFGDIAISGNAMLYGSTRVAPQMFFSINIGNGSYIKYEGATALDLQLAFGSNGLLYGTKHATGQFYTVDTSTGIQSAVGLVASGFADLASGMLFTPDYETAWGAGEDAGTQNWSMLIPVTDVPRFIETLSVQAYSSNTLEPVVASTTEVLEAGRTYMLVASGTADAQVGRPILFDAKYSLSVGETDWNDYVANYEIYGTKLLELFVDGNEADWGAYTDTHVYDVEITGDGTTLELYIYDVYYTNNTGFIRVDIYLMP